MSFPLLWVLNRWSRTTEESGTPAGDEPTVVDTPTLPTDSVRRDAYTSPESMIDPVPGPTRYTYLSQTTRSKASLFCLYLGASGFDGPSLGPKRVTPPGIVVSKRPIDQVYV